MAHTTLSPSAAKIDSCCSRVLASGAIVANWFGRRKSTLALPLKKGAPSIARGPIGRLARFGRLVQAFGFIFGLPLAKRSFENGDRHLLVPICGWRMGFRCRLHR